MPEKHFAGKYKIVKLVSHGAYAKVYHARDTCSGKSVAIKAAAGKKDSQLRLAEAEAEAMARLPPHRHVIGLVEVVRASGDVFVVTEFARCGDLFELVASRGRMGEDLSRHFFRQLISAVKHCHSRGVYHRDIKPENLLLDGEWGLKLSDFGLCAVADAAGPGPGPTLREPCGTPEYAAPEVLEGKGYDGAKADVWSCGVVLYVVATGCLPFDGGMAEMWGKMRRREMKMPKWLSPGLKWLLLRLLDPNPDTRITLDQISEDGWFTNNASLLDDCQEDSY